MQQCAVITTGRLSTDHIAALEGLHSPVTIQRRCADLAELIAAAHTARADAALIIGGTEQLTASTIAQLHEVLSAIVVVSDSAAERSRLAALGLSTFDDGSPPAQIAQALNSPTPFTPDAGADPGAEAEFTALVDSASLSGDLDTPQEAGTSTVVWGASGSPGRTTVAVNLAAELALSGRSVLLVDADTYAASAAVHLGLLEESAGIAQAVRAAEYGSLDAEVLLRSAASVEIGPARLEVLTGLPRADRWGELRPRALDRVLSLAGSRYDHVVVDTAAEIAPDQDLGFDAPAVQRNSAARTVLSRADQVIAVGAPDPVGFARLVKAVQSCADLLPEAASPKVVINKLRKQAVGRSPRRQLTETWLQMGPPTGPLQFLPWDPEACDAALRAGQLLAEAAPDSALRRQIAALVGIQVGRRRRPFSEIRGSSRSGRRGEQPDTR